MGQLGGEGGDVFGLGALPGGAVPSALEDPATTFVVINEVELEDWGIGGLPTEEYRRLKR